jgi:tetratricopeptide (TPR) repeat protein
MSQSSWSLLESGNYKAALEKLSDEIYQNPSRAFNYFNRALCYMKLSEFEQAILDLNKNIELLGNVSSGYEMLGVIHWINNDTETAISNWKKALKSEYKDASGGLSTHLLLLFAELHLKQHLAASAIKSKICSTWGKKPSDIWLCNIARYLDNSISGQDLLLSCKKTNLDTDFRKLVKAKFWILISDQENLSNTNFFNEMRKLTDIEPDVFSVTLEPEYWIAANFRLLN